jgi:hypothetical protein
MFQVLVIYWQRKKNLINWLWKQNSGDNILLWDVLGCAWKVKELSTNCVAWNMLHVSMLNNLWHCFLLVWREWNAYYSSMWSNKHLLRLFIFLTILNHIRDIKDPEHPYSLEELKVITEDAIEVDDKLSYVR